MKKIALSLAALAVSTAFISTSASAVEGLSANAAVSSNYLWRGITQTQDSAAVSGGIDYSHKSGAYAGTWASNVDFGGGSSGSETDFYFGYAGEAEGMTYDVGYIYYGYSGTVFAAGDSDFSEIYLNIGIDAFSFGINVLADTEWSGTDFGDDIYYTADYAVEVEGLEIGLHAGIYDQDAAADTVYDIGASVSKSGFTYALSKREDDSAIVSVSYAMDFDL